MLDSVLSQRAQARKQLRHEVGKLAAGRLVFEKDSLLQLEAPGARGSQFQLTRERERVLHAQLKARVEALPPVNGVPDRRLEAWNELDKSWKGEPRGDLFGGRWVTAFPCFRWFLTNAEFTRFQRPTSGFPALLALLWRDSRLLTRSTSSMPMVML